MRQCLGQCHIFFIMPSPKIGSKPTVSSFFSSWWWYRQYGDIPQTVDLWWGTQLDPPAADVPLPAELQAWALARHGGNFHAKQINLAGETQSCLRSTSRVSLLQVKQFSFLYNTAFCLFHDLNDKTENINVCFLHHSLKS